MHWIIQGKGINRVLLCLETGKTIKAYLETTASTTPFFGRGICRTKYTLVGPHNYTLKDLTTDFNFWDKAEKEKAVKQASKTLSEDLEALAEYLGAKPFEESDENKTK